MKTILFLLLTNISFIFTTIAQTTINPEKQWPSYRGYYAQGFLDNANLPDSWNAEKMENIKWKTKVPGLALSCPIV